MFKENINTNSYIIEGQITEFIEYNKEYPSGSTKNVFKLKVNAQEELTCVFWKRATNLNVGCKIQGRGWYMGEIFLFQSLLITQAGEIKKDG